LLRSPGRWTQGPFVLSPLVPRPSSIVYHDLMKTLIIGLGNTILRDDGVGIRAVHALRERIGDRRDIDVVELSVGGMRLMEEMAGYDRVLLIDAVMTGKNAAGTVLRLDIDDLAMSLHTSSTHDTSLSCALEGGRKLGIKLPSEIVIWGIEAHDVNTFGEDMTPEVGAAIPRVVAEMLEELDAASGRSRGARDERRGSKEQRTLCPSS
jgi:hydrogenase maturation protease